MDTPKDGFTEDDSTLGWLKDDDGKKLESFEAECLLDGFKLVPAHHAVGEDGYEYRFHGPLAYFKPILTNP